MSLLLHFHFPRNKNQGFAGRTQVPVITNYIITLGLTHASKKGGSRVQQKYQLQAKSCLHSIFEDD